MSLTVVELVKFVRLNSLSVSISFFHFPNLTRVSTNRQADGVPLRLPQAAQIQRLGTAHSRRLRPACKLWERHFWGSEDTFQW